MNEPIESTDITELFENEGSIETLPHEQLEYLQQIEELQPESWNRLEFSERMEALQELESRLAELQGRPPFQITAEEMGPYQYGYYDGRTLHLNQILVENADPREAVNTIAHEGRHAYQQFAIEHPGVHDPKEVAYWAANFPTYLDAATYGFEIYQNQPVEVDARDYALAIQEGLYA